MVRLAKTPIEGVDLNQVKVVENTKDGETLRTGGWVCYTVKDTYTKNAKKNRRLLRYVNAKAIAKASSSNEKRSMCLAGQSFYG